MLNFRKNVKLLFYIVLQFAMFSNNLYSQVDIIINGNMEFYGNYTNFVYIGGGYTTLNSPFSGISAPGQNANTTNPNLFNTSFISSGDLTTGNGQMLIVDGSTLSNSYYFWKGGYDGLGFCGLTIGKVYTFSYWVKSVSSLVTNPATQADIRIDFSNATNITLVSGSTMAPLPISGWQEVKYTFTAMGYCVNINLWDYNTNTVGNDFALDNFSLMPPLLPLSVDYSLSSGNCDYGIALFPYTSGGNINLASYTLTGLSYSNTNGDFINLQPGNYVLTVVDVDGNSASTNVVIPQNNGLLTVSPSHTICAGDSTALSVSGSTTGYYWTSSPNDSSLTNPTGATPIVSPTTTTTYTVISNSTAGSGNLIYNGDFSMGNTGFDSQHLFYPTNLENAAGAYGVVSDASLWGTNFPNCGDQTTGTGNMLVVNGTDHLSGAAGTSFWEQGVTLQGTTNYTFSFWVQSLSGNFPAAICVSMNGSIYNVSPYLAPSTTNCGNWVQYSMNYFSGWVHGVTIGLLDNTVSFIGNDFAIDDISLTSISSCMYNSITVTVNQPLSVNINHNSSTTNAITFDWNTLPLATGYTISYSVNNGASINAGTVTSNTFTVNSLAAGDAVNIVVTPIGTGCFRSATHVGNSFSPCPTPSAIITQQPTCSIPLGTITVSSPLGMQYEYSLDGTTFQSSPVFTNLIFGNYTVTVKNTGTGCQSTSSSLSLYQAGITLPNISASYTYQNCSINLVASSITPNTSIVWNGPNIALNAPNPSVTSSSGTYIATITDLLSGCTNNFSINVIAPIRPNQPAVAVTQPSCNTSSGNITIASPLGTNYEYSIDGSNYQSGIIFQNLIPATYFITVKDITTGCISSINQVVLNSAILAAPIPTINNIILCQNSIASPLSASPVPNVTLNWYGTNASGGASSTTATIPNTSNVGTTLYYFSQTLGLCESPRVPITVTVSGVATIPDFKDLKYCFGDNNIPPLHTVSPNGISGTWQPVSISNTTSGTYIFTPDPNECATEQRITITINLPILISFDWIVKEEFTDNQVLIITTDIQVDYLYQLDLGVPQISPVFNNITPGFHSITVYDSNNCSNPVTRNDIIVINYPKFFTPNNDGYNDFWSIPALYSQQDASIQIFDRYGKLLKVLKLKNSEVWDGNYNGVPLPSSDYWFVVNYRIHDVSKTFKSHFSIKR